MEESTGKTQTYWLAICTLCLKKWSPGKSNDQDQESNNGII